MLDSRRAIWFVLVFAFVAHVSTLFNDYAFDAQTVCEKSPLVLEFDPIETFTSDYWGGSGQERLNSNPLYRPITVLSYVCTDRILASGESGTRPAPFPQHLVDLLLHCVAVYLVFLLVQGMTGPGLAPVLAALVFAAHSIHAEVVASVVGRADLLAFVFGAAAVRTFVSAYGDRLNRRRVVLSGFLLWLAFCSKESSLAWLPFLIVYGVGVDLAQKRAPRALQWSLRALYVGLLPVAFWFFLRWNAFRGLDASWEVAYLANNFAPPHAGALESFLTAIMTWGYGLWMTLCPWRLVCDYGPLVFDGVQSFGDPRFLASAAALLSCLAFGLWSVRRAPLLFVAMAAWFGFSFATSNVPFSIGVVFAERLYYMPSIGLCFVVAWLAQRFDGRGMRVVVAAVVAWSLVFGVRSFVRCSAWKNDTTLFLGDVARQPRSLPLHLQASRVARAAGDLAESNRHLEAILAIQPDYAQAYVDLWSNLMQERRFDDALETVEQGLRARIVGVHGHELHLNAAILYSATNQKDKARTQILAALDASTNATDTYRSLVVGQKLLSTAELEARIREGEQRDPDLPFWNFVRARRALRSQDYATAARLWRSSLPTMPLTDLAVQDAYLSFVDCLGRTGQLRDAARVLESILANPDFSNVRLRAEARKILEKIRGL